MLFDFGPHHLDRIEIGTVGRQEEQLCSAFFDQVPSLLITMSTEIIADDQIAWLQGRTKDLSDIFSEDQRVCRAFNYQASRLAVETDRAQHCRSVPLSAWGMVMKSGTSACSSPQSCQIGLRARFIQENQPLAGPLLLGFSPKTPFFLQINAILFAGP